MTAAMTAMVAGDGGSAPFYGPRNYLRRATDDRLRFTRCHSKQSIAKDSSIVQFPVLLPPG